MKKSNKQKIVKGHSDKLPKWNLGLLYKSPNDPQIEKDVALLERKLAGFAKKFDVPDKAYLKDEYALFKSLKAYEEMVVEAKDRPLLYFCYLQDLEAKNPVASSFIPLFKERLTKADNKIRFFKISLGAMPKQQQERFLKSHELEHFRYFLHGIFTKAEHWLSVPEEKIMALKSQPAHDMWISHNERLLNSESVVWKGSPMPLAQALNSVQNLKTASERRSLSAEISKTLKSIAPFTEGEINAVFTNKKINDSLRGNHKPYESTVRHYENDPVVVERLIRTVGANYGIAHRFHRLKAKLLKQKRLSYCDRAAKIGTIKAKLSFQDSYDKLHVIFGRIGGKYADILDSFVMNGQIDAAPRTGKTSGAYCSGSYGNPTFVLLNHVDGLHSFTTFAHEMGHAIHTELSRAQGPLYHSYSTALAETASTLFESIALENVFETLSEKEKIIVLHDKINDDISTIFRQIACFNFELDLHNAIRAKGFVPKEEIAAIHNKRMKEYLGPLFDISLDDGYMFVHWSHIRRFFYVYTYAFGQLVSKAMLRRYRQDPTFWEKIEQFLSSGGKDSPENILKEIGINVKRPDFWMEGLKEIEDDIDKLEALTR